MSKKTNSRKFLIKINLLSKIVIFCYMCYTDFIKGEIDMNKTGLQVTSKGECQMKRTISVVCLVVMLLMLSIHVFAGDVPEALLHDDGAQVFFAEVVYYHPDKENPDIELSPVKVIKGDVKTGVKLTYLNPNTVGDFNVKTGNVYLFTYFDEHNPTYIFETTTYDTATIKLKNATGDMWERFEKYLNNGDYEKAEQNRINRKNETVVKTGKTMTLTEYAEVDTVNTKSSVSIYSGPLAVEVERDKFLEIANQIILEETEPVFADLNNSDNIIISLPENMSAVYISSDCKVSCQDMTKSLILPNRYIIKAEDMAKISSLLEAERELPPMRSKGFLAYAVVVLVLAVSALFIIKRRMQK